MPITRKHIPIIATLGVVCWCVWMNATTRLYFEGGGRFVPSTLYANPLSPLSRKNGWPRDYLIRTHWAKITVSPPIFLYHMRPTSTRFTPSSLIANGLTTIATALCTYLASLSVIERRIPLRAMMILITCISIMTVLVVPWVQKNIDEKRGTQQGINLLNTINGGLLSPNTVQNADDDGTQVRR